MKSKLFCCLSAALPLLWLAGCTPTGPSAHPQAAAVSTTAPGAAPDTANSSNAISVHFTDIAKTSGIDYVWHPVGTRPLNILGTIGNGCALFDYDNDGNLDVLLVGSKLALYKGDGKGHFTDVTHETGLDQLKGYFLGCAVGDYDNDGYDDVYLTAYRGGALLHNEAGKRFVDTTKSSGMKPQAWSTSASWVDVDHDGKLDLYICNYSDFSPETKPQLCPQGQPTVLTACGPRFYTAIKGVLYHNIGNGKFMDVTKAWGVPAIHGKGLGVAAADYDGSGRPSLALANDEVEGDFLQNQGRKFKEIGAESGTAFNNDGQVHGGMGADWGDYDNDGKLDLVIATFQHEAKCVYHNDGSNLFTESSAQLGLSDKALPWVSFGTKFLDFDNDGYLDLIFANGHVQDNIDQIDSSTSYKQPLLLLHNEQGKSFSDTSAAAGPAFLQKVTGRGLAVGDIDNDGRLDVLVVDSEGAPLLLHNETTTANHWLLCRLQGTKSNRDGIGSLLTFTLPDGSKRLRYCSTDGSYMSSSDRRVHCGLGNAASADITVRWPSGTTNTYKGVKADQVITLLEGVDAPTLSARK